MQTITLPKRDDLLIAIEAIEVTEKKQVGNKVTSISVVRIEKGQVVKMTAGHGLLDDGTISVAILPDDLDTTFGKDRDKRRTNIHLTPQQFNSKFAFADPDAVDYLNQQIDEEEDRFNDLEI